MKKLISIILVLALALSLTACSKAENPGSTDDKHSTVDDMINKNDKGDKVSTYLFMGIDQNGEYKDREQWKRGQNDADYLLVVNDTQKCYTLINFNRDTMATFPLLDATGDSTGLTVTQVLCLAHAWGDGQEKSCENVVAAVSGIMGGIVIDRYFALEMDAIPVINDMVGGICVTIEDEFRDSDPEFVVGATVELKGQQALTFVRSRMNVGDGYVPGRMRRQEQYLNAFSARLSEELTNNSNIINKIYSACDPYLCSSMSLSELTNVALKCNEYENKGTVTLEGTQLHDVPYPDGNVYAEFHADADAAKSLAKDLGISFTTEEK